MRLPTAYFDAVQTGQECWHGVECQQQDVYHSITISRFVPFMLILITTEFSVSGEFLSFFGWCLLTYQV